MQRSFYFIQEKWIKETFLTVCPAITPPTTPPTSQFSSLWPAKDIHDFDGLHGDWLEHAAVALAVHHHHEEITAGDLLDHEGPANHSTDSQEQGDE